MTTAGSLAAPGLLGAATPVAGIEFAVATDVDTIAADWRALEAAAVGSPFQRLAFHTAWLGTLGRRKRAAPLVVTGRRAGRLVAVVPLVVSSAGPIRIAEFAGGSHANGNVGLFDPALWAGGLPDALAGLLAAIERSGRGVDVVRLHSQPRTFAGRPNPFVGSTARPARHSSYELSLSDGFEGVLARHRGSKKKKRLRQHLRGLEAFGPVSFAAAAAGPDAARLIDVFLAQKAERFAGQGIPNVFAEPGTREFFHALAGGADPVFACYGLTVGDALASTAIVAPYAGTVQFVMNSFEIGRLDRCSPGDVTLFHLIEDAAARGYHTFDFGIGDARYKRSWTDREVPLADTVVPLTALGGLAAGALALDRRLREAVAANPRLRALARTILRRREPPPDEAGGGED